jgi:hypothetical protein
MREGPFSRFRCLQIRKRQLRLQSPLFERLHPDFEDHPAAQRLVLLAITPTTSTGSALPLPVAEAKSRKHLWLSRNQGPNQSCQMHGDWGLARICQHV